MTDMNQRIKMTAGRLLGVILAAAGTAVIIFAVNFVMQTGDWFNVWLFVLIGLTLLLVGLGMIIKPQAATALFRELFNSISRL